MNLVVSKLTPDSADNIPCPMDIKLSERKTSDLKVRKTRAYPQPLPKGKGATRAQKLIISRRNYYFSQIARISQIGAACFLRFEEPWFFFCPGWNPEGIGGRLEAWALSLLKGASMQTLHQRHCLNQNKRVFIVLVNKQR